MLYGAGEFNDSGGLGLLLHAAQPATDVQDVPALPPTRASRRRGEANGSPEVNGSLEAVPGIEQEDLNPQQRGEQQDAGPANGAAACYLICA